MAVGCVRRNVLMNPSQKTSAQDSCFFAHMPLPLERWAFKQLMPQATISATQVELVSLGVKLWSLQDAQPSPYVGSAHDQLPGNVCPCFVCKSSVAFDITPKLEYVSQDAGWSF